MGYNRKTLLNATIWKLLERFSAQIVSFVVSIVLARILLPEDYGVIAILMVFINLANVIVDGGFNTALIQKKDADNVDFSTIFLFSLLFSVFLYLIIFLSAPLISYFYDNPILTPVLRVLGVIIFFNSIGSIQRAYVAKHMVFQQLFYSSLGSVLLSGLVGIWMAIKGYGVWALVAQQIVAQFATVAIMWITLKWKPVLVFSINRFKSLFDYGWKIFMTNFIVAVYEDIRSLIIGKLYQPASLAFFDRGKQLPSLLMTNINASIQAILLPAFAADQDNRERVKQMMRRSMKLNSFFVLPLLVGLFVTAKPLVIVLLTEKWLDAVPFIQIFCAAFMLMPIQSSNMVAIKSLGYSDVTLKLEIIKKVLEACIMIITFFISVYAVAWGIFIYNFICVFINLSPNKRLLNYGIGEQIIDVAPVYGISILMGCCVYCIGLLPLPNIGLLLIQVISGAALYVLLCKFFRVDSLDYCIDFIRNRG